MHFSLLPEVCVFSCWVLLIAYWQISARHVKQAVERQSWSGRIVRLPIWLGYVFFVSAGVHPFGAMILPHALAIKWLGVALCAFGLALAIWARRTLGAEWSRDVELKKGHELIERGPYGLMRHPIYTAHLLIGLGTAIESGRVVGLAALGLFLVGFWMKSKQEEKLLLRTFPDKYAAYMARVKALVPFVI